MAGTIFISYNHQDREFVRLLDASLRLVGVETIRDERDLKVGESIPHWVFNSIAKANGALFILSQHSAGSAWLEEEISAAKSRRIEEPQFKILPLLLDEVEVPPPLRHFRFVGFTNWLDADEFRFGVASLCDALGVQPLLISGDEVHWWLSQQGVVSPARDALATIFGYLDAAVGYPQWFSSTSLGWIDKEAREGQFDQAVAVLDSVLPSAAGDRRMVVIRENLEELAQWRTISRPGHEYEENFWARRAWVSLGRVLAVLSEIEASAVMVVRSASDIPKGTSAPGDREQHQSSGLESPFEIVNRVQAVLPEDQPNDIDALWVRYQEGGAESDLKALRHALEAVFSAALGKYRKEVAAEGSPLAGHESELRNGLETALHEAIHSHPAKLGVSIEWTARKRLDQVVRKALHDYRITARVQRASPKESSPNMFPIVLSAMTLAVAARAIAAWRREKATT